MTTSNVTVSGTQLTIDEVVNVARKGAKSPTTLF